MGRLTTLAAAILCSGALVHGCSGGSSGNPANGSDAGSDGSTADVVQADVAAEAAAHESGSDAPGDASGSTCPTPADLSSWKSPSYVPAKTSPGACASTELTGFDAACISAQTASTSVCTAFRGAHTTCVSCLESKSTDSSWGPLVLWGGQADVNFGGCLQLEAPSQASCALAAEVWDACTHAACDAACPVTSQASFTQWTQCRTTADANACSTYLTQSDCIVDAATGTVCEPGQATFEQLFLAIAPLFCGGGADSGAADASGQ